MEVKLSTSQEMDMSIASGIPIASPSRPGDTTTASVYSAVSSIARYGHKGHLWSETVMPLYSEETGMSLSGS